MVRTLLALAALLMLLLPQESTGQPLSCEDQLRALRIYAETVANARTRHEVEAAQALAGLVKRVETLQAELARLKQENEPGKK